LVTLAKLVMLFEDQDATQTWAVSFGTDSAAGNTTSLGTFSGSDQLQTLFFGSITNPETATVCRDVGLYFQKTFSGSKNNARIKAWQLHAIAAIAEKLKLATMTVQLGGATLGNAALQDTLPGESTEELTVLLKGYEEATYPFKLVEDWNGDGVATVHNVLMRPGTRTDEPNDRRSSFQLQEIDNIS